MWAEQGPIPSWLPTHPLPFSTCAECQTHSVEGAGRTESTPLMSSSTPGPHTGSYSLLQHVTPASSKRSDRQSKAGPRLGQSWHLVIQSPEVSQQCFVPRVLQRIALLCCLWVSQSECVSIYIYRRKCVGRLWSDSSARQTTASVDCPGRCRVSAQAEKHMIYFWGKDVGIQRGHIYSLLVWWEDLPVKAQILKKWHGDECYFQWAVMNSI